VVVPEDTAVPAETAVPDLMVVLVNSPVMQDKEVAEVVVAPVVLPVAVGAA
jgi:hypothetical protein